jgi:hypothetical protein
MLTSLQYDFSQFKTTQNTQNPIIFPSFYLQEIEQKITEFQISKNLDPLFEVFSGKILDFGNLKNLKICHDRIVAVETKMLDLIDLGEVDVEEDEVPKIRQKSILQKITYLNREIYKGKNVKGKNLKGKNVKGKMMEVEVMQELNFTKRKRFMDKIEEAYEKKNMISWSEKQEKRQEILEEKLRQIEEKSKLSKSKRKMKEIEQLKKKKLRISRDLKKRQKKWKEKTMESRRVFLNSFEEERKLRNLLAENEPMFLKLPKEFENSKKKILREKLENRKKQLKEYSRESIEIHRKRYSSLIKLRKREREEAQKSRER